MTFAKTFRTTTAIRRGFFGLSLAVAAALPGLGEASAAEVITLTQTGCQFLEPEGRDHSYKTMKKTDCEAINAKSGESRVAASQTIKLKPGDYVFRVTNKNVPYELGFWLRDRDYDWRNPLHKVTKTSVSGGGLHPGTSGDYEVTLKPGEYLYSCPLNTTPDYHIVVAE